MNATETTDETLFSAYQASGNQAAFATLYERHNDSLKKRIRRTHFLKDDVADDVLQECWLVASKQEQPVTNFRGWILSVAIHQAGTRLTKRKRERRHCEQLRQADVRDEVTASLEDRKVATETEAQLLEAVQHLPKQIGEALRLIAFYGLSESRVACEFKIPLTTLRRRLKEAREFLREQIGDGPKRRVDAAHSPLRSHVRKPNGTPAFEGNGNTRLAS